MFILCACFVLGMNKHKGSQSRIENSLILELEKEGTKDNGTWPTISHNSTKKNSDSV